jgi:hypothetical protein
MPPLSYRLPGRESASKVADSGCDSADEPDVKPYFAKTMRVHWCCLLNIDPLRLPGVVEGAMFSPARGASTIGGTAGTTGFTGHISGGFAYMRFSNRNQPAVTVGFPCHFDGSAGSRVCKTWSARQPELTGGKRALM